MTFEKSLLDQKREEFRRRLGNKIPAELDTSFNLDRWLVNYELVSSITCLFAQPLKHYNTQIIGYKCM